MSVLLVLIPVTLLFVVVGGIAFFWAVNHDQFDDMDTPALEPLADSDPEPMEDARQEPAQGAGRVPAPDIARQGQRR